MLVVRVPKPDCLSLGSQDCSSSGCNKYYTEEKNKCKQRTSARKTERCVQQVLHRRERKKMAKQIRRKRKRKNKKRDQPKKEPKKGQKNQFVTERIHHGQHPATDKD